MNTGYELINETDVDVDENGNLVIKVHDDLASDTFFPSKRRYYATAEYLDDLGNVIASSNEVKVDFIPPVKSNYGIRINDDGYSDPSDGGPILMTPAIRTKINGVEIPEDRLPEFDYRRFRLIAIDLDTMEPVEADNFRWELETEISEDLDFTNWDYITGWDGVESSNGYNGQDIDLMVHRLTYEEIYDYRLLYWHCNLIVSLYIDDVLVDEATFLVESNEQPIDNY